MKKISFLSLAVVVLLVLFAFVSLMPKVYAETKVLQNIANDTVWDITRSPYIISPAGNKIVVEEHATLTINPGVVVKFFQGKALEVIGKIKSLGTPDQHIVFTSVYDDSNEPADTPAPGDWYGVYVNGGGSDFFFSEIRYAGRKKFLDQRDSGALTLTGENIAVKNSLVRDSASNCIYSYLAFGVISKNTVQNCETNGMFIDMGGQEVSYNVVQKALEAGIKIKSASNIHGNVVQNNSIGVLIKGNSPVIQANDIRGNNNAGVSIIKGDPEIKLNAVHKNDMGILIKRYFSGINIRNNDIIDNRGKNIKIEDGNMSGINAKYNFFGKNIPPGIVSVRKNPQTKFLADPVLNTKAPVSPQNVRAYFIKNSIKITFDRGKEKDIALYHVFKSENPEKGYKRIGSVTDSSFNDWQFVRGKIYYYKVAAADLSGNESLLSPYAAVLVRDFSKGKVFEDVKNTDWFYIYVKDMRNKGVIQGYEDQSVSGKSFFKPNQNVTRAELVKMAIEAKGIEASASGVSRFIDVPDNSWFAPYILKASEMNVIQGYYQNRFKPETPVTRAEALKIILLIFGKNVPETKKTSFIDVIQGSWYKDYIEYSAQQGIIEGYDGNFFRPNYPITRAETVKILWKILQK